MTEAKQSMATSPKREDRVAGEEGMAGPSAGETAGRSRETSSVLNLKELPRTGKRGAPQAFPHLLYLMLEREPTEVIRWTQEGRAFMIMDLPAFIKHTLVKYFRHTRYASFQRQLNLYGFRKNQSGAFEHKCFRQDSPHLLTYVQRSPQPSKVKNPPTKASPEDDERPRFEKMLYLKLAGSLVEPN
mmetsp:Transcript_2936/g.9168  ORF Transcript_2936/g.9168 Transcript_2936/m.9168 type:complete len:186 (+) Transcript_2936:44-601(+)